MPQAAFNRLVAKHSAQVEKLVNRLASGSINTDQFGDGMHAILYRGHSDAVTLGRNHAGDRSKQSEDDQLIGVEISDGEDEWLNRFVDDIKSGRYTDDEGKLNTAAVERRGNMYSVKLRATANQAFVDASDSDQLWVWRLGLSEHCSDCQDLADASPLTVNELWTTPGGCDTDCMLGCNCHIERMSDGKRGF